ncbi:hypothetical protein Bpla01_43630 [Burkholderia plantarii]|nr:hypothetical protein Bpla01_43630 [Burkholderia plantarii]
MAAREAGGRHRRRRRAALARLFETGLAAPGACAGLTPAAPFTRGRGRADRGGRRMPAALAARLRHARRGAIVNTTDGTTGGTTQGVTSMRPYTPVAGVGPAA